jgi:hypothetical protein
MQWQDLKTLAEKAYCILSVYMYDHSGLTLNTTGFSCPWDSGCLGWIYVSHNKIKEEFGEVTPETVKKAEKLLDGEVKDYDYYLTGQCYGFKLYKKEEEIDSCWGFLGDFRDVQDSIKGICPMNARILWKVCKNVGTTPAWRISWRKFRKTTMRTNLIVNWKMNFLTKMKWRWTDDNTV